MKNKNFISLLLSVLVLSSCGTCKNIQIAKEIIEPDNTVYDDNLKVDLRNPEFRSGESDDEEEEDESFVVDKVLLHYYNEDGACNKAGKDGRAFYVWVPGIDGEEYSDESNVGRVDYSNDGTMMTVTIDMINDEMFQPFYGTGSIMYIIKYKMESKSNLNWGGQSEDVELKFSTFNPKDKVVEVWCTPAAGGGIAQFDSEEKTKVEGVKLATFSDWKTITCTLSANATKVNYDLYAFDETYYKVKAKNRAAIKKNYKILSGETTSSTFTIPLKYNAHINAVYCIESSDVNGTPGLTKIVYASFEKLYGTARFEKYYNYKENDLGVTYTPEETTFKVWSPVAANVSVLLYNSDTSAAYDGSDKYKGWHMNYQPGGIWTLTIKGDLANDPAGYKYYNYSVDTWATSGVTMDPYAKACGACGVRGLVYDKSTTNPEGWDEVNNNLTAITTPQELTIYEVHVQDFTGDKTWVSNHGNKRGTFNAFVESGTTYTENEHTVSTGFDHLKELGVGAVQLVPVFDSDNDEVKNTKYNWGYNPLNYNCVEGAYSSNPHDGLARIREYKNMINELAKEDMRTIMDVVYNHVSSPSASCFNKLMPRYFFRYDENGELHDGSGCHNEFKSEATMARKYIVDSVCWWAEEYNIKGFRFDLMGLIDVETMKAAKKALYKIDPSIYLYGEGWTAGGFHGGLDAENYNIQSKGTFAVPGSGYTVYTDLYEGKSHEQCYLGAFDGSARDALKGSNDIDGYNGNHKPNYGFINKGRNDLNDGFRVSLENMAWGKRGDGQGGNPKQTIAYASCHDNWTLRDQLYGTLGTSSNPPHIYDVLHGVMASETYVFASNSAAFMLGGEELLRSKEIVVGENGVTQEEFDKIPVASYEDIYGHKISHNSYNSPIAVNAFNWANKVSLTVDGNTVDMFTENLTAKFANLIALHKEMPKYDYDQMQEIFTNKKTSAGNDIINFSWHGKYWDGEDKDNVGVICVQFDEWFIFICARQFGYVRDANIKNWTKKASGGCYSFNEGTGCLDLGDGGTGIGLSCVVYKR